MKFDKSALRREAVFTVLYPFLYLTIFIFRIMPICLVRKFAFFVGTQFYTLSEKQRKRALTNLENVYGNELSADERITIAKGVFVEMIKSFFDYMALSHITCRERFFSRIKVEGQEHLQAAYEKGKGVICLIPHLSSWELAAITPPMLGYETSAASKELRMKLLQNMMVKYRARRGMKNITREGSYAKLIDVLHKGECLILMIDQDTRVKGAFVDFMGKTAYTPIGASRLALETGASIVPMVMTREKDDNYRFIIQPELPLIRTGNLEADLFENTQRQTKVIEEMVRTYPSQWVWMHCRWRRTPEIIALERGK